MRHRLVLMTLTLLVLAGCGDKRILLNYVPDAAASKPAEDAPAVMVFAFRDARGDESDGNPYRVGGVYGGYGNRLSTVLAEKPVVPILVDALAAGFRARGVPAQAVADREFRAGDPSVTGYALGGELRNFSTEARFTNSAHISALVRLYAPNGTVAAEKEISHRIQSEYGGGGVRTSSDDLQRIMNEVLAQFGQRVVTDPDITARLRETPQ
jgi:ABC-type uncharacterized transport system auxiliary subunit